MTDRCTVVIPCYNERDRLDIDALADFLSMEPAFDLLLVDDGSRDDTAGLLREFAAACPDRVEALILSPNGGKAEAVRRGMLQALERAQIVGFLDADLATPLDQLPILHDVLIKRPAVDWVFGSRVKLMGRTIDRRLRRHLLGRAFATAVSITLQLPVYDTQCGAKLFRVTPDLADVLDAPFHSRWIFDVELIERLIANAGGSREPARRRIVEVPLDRWTDIPGSKVSAGAFVLAARELGGIAWRLRAGRSS